MIEVLDTEAAGIVLARGKLACPACGQMMGRGGTPASGRSATWAGPISRCARTGHGAATAA